MRLVTDLSDCLAHDDAPCNPTTTIRTPLPSVGRVPRNARFKRYWDYVVEVYAGRRELS